MITRMIILSLYMNILIISSRKNRVHFVTILKTKFYTLILYTFILYIFDIQYISRIFGFLCTDLT